MGLTTLKCRMGSLKERKLCSRRSGNNQDSALRGKLSVDSRKYSGSLREMMDGLLYHQLVIPDILSLNKRDRISTQQGDAGTILSLTQHLSAYIHAQDIVAQTGFSIHHLGRNSGSPAQGQRQYHPHANQGLVQYNQEPIGDSRPLNTRYRCSILQEKHSVELILCFFPS